MLRIGAARARPQGGERDGGTGRGRGSLGEEGGGGGSEGAEPTVKRAPATSKDISPSYFAET